MIIFGVEYGLGNDLGSSLTGWSFFLHVSNKLAAQIGPARSLRLSINNLHLKAVPLRARRSCWEPQPIVD